MWHVYIIIFICIWLGVLTYTVHLPKTACIYILCRWYPLLFTKGLVPEWLSLRNKFIPFPYISLNLFSTWYRDIPEWVHSGLCSGMKIFILELHFIVTVVSCVNTEQFHSEMKSYLMKLHIEETVWIQSQKT